MVIRTTADEAEISGSIHEFRAMRRLIRRLLASQDRVATVSAVPGNPAPYDNVLSVLVIHRTSGPCRVAIAGETLVVSGSDETLDGFASFFRFPKNGKQGRHAHFEYYPDNPYISADSLPLTIAVDDD